MPENLNTVSKTPEDFTPAIVQEWLPESLMACFVVGIVERLDLSKLENHYGDDRKQATTLRILLALLFHGYTSGIFSSRELEQASYDSEAFRFITANTHPGQALISSFRKRFLKELEGLFVQIMVIARSMGLIKRDDENLNSKMLEEQLRREAVSLLIRAEKADARDRQQQERKPEGATGEEAATGQTQAPSTEINEDMPGDPFSTYTFLSKKGAVPAQESTRGSRAHASLRPALQHPVLVMKTLAAALFRTRPRTRRRRQMPMYAYPLLVLLVVTGALLLGQIIGQDNHTRPGTGRHAGGDSSAVVRSTANADTVTGRPPRAAVTATPKRPVKQAGASGNPAANDNTDAGAIQTLAENRQQIPLVLPVTAPTDTGKATRQAGSPDAPAARPAQQPGPGTAAAVAPETPPAASAPPDAAATARPPNPQNPPQQVTDGMQVAPSAGTAGHASEDSRADRPADRRANQPPAKTGTRVAALQETVTPTATDRPAARRDTARPQSGSLHREGWLLDQPDRRYMLQLLGTRYEDALLEFVERHKPAGPLAYYKGSYKGKDWYVLLQGDFPSNQAAIDAIETLPKSISKNRPWPRRLGSIQTAILEEKLRLAQ
ncbi:MAG: SPOR domain-containing protein [Gammaproteobacteria bacterium]|jgi:transposase